MKRITLYYLILTLGVWFLTLPARAKEPCTLPKYKDNQVVITN